MDSALHSSSSSSAKRRRTTSSAFVKRRRTLSFAKWQRASSFAFAKRRRASSSAFAKRKTSPRRQLLCIPCYHACEMLKGAFDIYLVDLTSTDSSVGDAISPTLSIDAGYFNVHTLCVLGSKLYMFQSSHEWEDNPALMGNGTAVANVNLSEYLTRRNVKLEDNMIGYTNPMQQPKRFPIATPTPSGKLLVFSSHIRSDRDDDEASHPIDFELYDPATEQWKPLPQIYDNWEKDRKCSRHSLTIESFAFMSESILLIITQSGMFELELESSRGWQDWVTHARKIPRPCGASFSVTEDGLCFSPYFAFDINTPKSMSVCYHFPLTAFATDDYELRVSHGIIQTLDNGREGNFCLVQTAVNEHIRCPHLAIDVYRCDLAKYREDKRNLIAKYREDKRNLIAKYRENKHKLKDNYRGEDNQKRAIDELKNNYRGDKVRLKLGETLQLSTSLEKSFKFILETQSCWWFVPLSLSFVLSGTSTT